MRYLRKAVDRLREDRQAYRTEPFDDALEIREDGPARKKPEDNPRRALDEAVCHENAHYLAAREAERLQKPDFRRLLDGKDEKRVHHAEERDKGNQQEKNGRHVLFDGERREELAVGLAPGEGANRSGGVEEWGSGGVGSFHDSFDEGAELRGVGRAVCLDVNREHALLKPHQITHIRERRDRITGIVVVLSAREYADNLPLYREIHLVLRGERLGRIDRNLVADPAPELARGVDPKHDGVAVEIERARAGSADLVRRREVIRVHAEKNRRENAVAVGKEDAGIDLGRDASDARNGAHRRGDPVLFRDNVAARGQNRDVGLEAQYLLLPLVAKTRHHAPDDNDGGDAEHHAKNRDAGNDRRDRSLRLKVFGG